MNQSVRILSIAVATLVVLAQIPARAQYSTEFVPAKLIKEGTTSTTIAGSGKVVVQVQVNADGSHKVTKIISSTNSGDNAAATEIANSSTYRPARRGTTPITAFYDFTLRFNGRVFVRSSSQSSGVSLAGASLTAAANQVAALIRAGRYEQAKSKAQLELLSSPGDDSLRQMLGLAAYDGGDFTTAAAAFDKVATISAQFRAPAAQSFAAASVKGAADNPQQSLAYAKKAVALVPDTNSHFALGVAQLANNDAAAAVASLKAAHDAAMTDSKIPLASKVNIDAELLQAYLANNDEQDAQAMAAAIKQLDPTSTAGARAMGASLLKSGQAAAVAKDTATALHDYEQAAALGDTTIAVTANVLAAFAVAQSVKPDYKRMQSYADKAIAQQPDNAQANFAEGIALAGQWASSHDDGTKKKAADALANADRLAKAGGNEALSLQIETFVKQNLNSGSGGSSGSGP